MWTVMFAAHASAPAPVPAWTGLPPTLFDRVALVDVKATSETPTCEGALAALIEKAKEIGAKQDLKTILAFYPEEGLAQPALTHVPCKLTGVPDAPSGAAASAKVLMIHPGYGFPNVAADRQAALIGLLASVHQVPPDGLTLSYEDGKVWVNAGVREHEPVFGPEVNLNARGVLALQAHIVPWVGRWAPVATSAPEVAGAILGVGVKSTDEKGKKRKEIFYYRADAPGAAAFTVGRVSEEDWIARLPVTFVEDGKKGPPRPLVLDPNAPMGSVTATGRGILGDLSDLSD